MKRRGLIFINYLMFLGLTLFLATLQSSLWPQLFSYFPAPQFWLITLAYWVMGRYLIEGLIMTYLLSLLVGALTAMPVNLVLAVNIILFCGGILLKQRIFWIGSTYLMILSGLGALLFPIIHLIISWSFEANPIRSPEILDWFFICLFCTFLSPPLFFVFKTIDKLTSKELPSEVRPDIL